jgi:DNA-binding FadR family transcriptional regulator
MENATEGLRASSHPELDGQRARRPARMASVVVEEIAHRILGGALVEGSVLPTEPALEREFGFSRSVIREGLKLLEERGLVRVEQGRGTTVQGRDSWNLLDPAVLRIALVYDHDMVLLDDLIAVRRLLEREMARAAATRLSEDELAVLAENVNRMTNSIGDYEQFRLLDFAFHAGVMRASGSQIGRTIVRTIHMNAGHALRLSTPGARASLESTVSEHRAIHEALVARDGELAASRTAAHIDSAWAERRNKQFD